MDISIPTYHLNFKFFIILVTIVLDSIFNSIALVLYVSRNQCAIVSEGPDNPGTGLAGACTFQDKQIGQ